MALIHFFTSLWNKRFRMSPQKTNLPSNGEVDNIREVYTVDKKLRRHLVTKAFKETPTWKNGAKNRKIAYCLLFSPLAVYGVIFAGMGMFGVPLGTAAADASVIPLISMVILWPCAIIILKSEYHNAKIIPEDRLHDELVLGAEKLSYSFYCTSDGNNYKNTMKYQDIIRIQYSVKRKMLFVFGGKLVRTYKRKTLIESRRFDKQRGLYISIPLYLKDSDIMMEELSKRCQIPIERIEEAL